MLNRENQGSWWLGEAFMQPNVLCVAQKGSAGEAYSFTEQGIKKMALVGFRGDGERYQVTSASIKELSSAFPRLRAL
jgi:hypothetical protein